MKKFSTQVVSFGLLLSTNSVLGQGAVLEEVVVTAQKREESMQEVPVTVQAFSGEQLHNAGVTKVSDITKLAPNLNVVVQNAMSQHIVIRGVGTNEFFGNAPSSVGMYMDEVTMNSSYMSTLGLFDMERVEVLRGPQNSLFGRNTTGGAVNYISRLPVVGEEFTGYFLGTYGMHNLFEVESGVTLPMGNSAALRLAGKWHSRDGRWNNITNGDSEYGDTERYSVRGTLVYEPGDNTVITASFHTARDNSDAYPQKAFGTLDPNAGGNGHLSIFDERTVFGEGYTSDISFDQQIDEVTSQGYDVSTTNWDDVRAGGSQVSDLDLDGAWLKIQHDFGSTTFTSISAFDDTHALYEEDNGVSGLTSGPNGDGVNQEALLINMDQDYSQFSQELRLSSNDDARFRWIAGLYYFSQDSTLGQSIRFGDNGVLAFSPFFAGGFAPTDPPFNFPEGTTPDEAAAIIGNPFQNTAAFSIAELEDRSISVYGHTDYDLTENTTLTIGLRYTEDTKSNPSYYGGTINITGNAQSLYYSTPVLRQLSADLPPCPEISPTQPPFTIGCANDNRDRPDIESEEVGGKIGLSHHLADETMLFYSYSRGFKSGKFDVEFLHTDATPFPQRSLDVEILDVFELGLKSTVLDGRLQFNGAIFHNTWKDQQVFNVGANGPEFHNLPESEIVGLELEMKWVPADSWLINAGLGLLDSEITDASGISTDEGGEFQEGHELPLSPETTANLMVIKDIELGSNILTLQMDGRYQSAAKAKFKESFPIDEYQSRFVTNARASYFFGATKQYQAGLFLTNLTEEQYCLEKQDLHALVGAFYCVPNQGERQWGVDFRASF